MENYIIRVYRRDIQNSSGVTGLVENVENEERVAFHSLEELCSILSIIPSKTREDLRYDVVPVRVHPQHRG